MMLDENFLKRVYKTSFYFLFFITGLLLLGGFFWEVFEISSGFLLSILLLYILEVTVKKSFQKKEKIFLFKVSLIKYPLLILIAYFLVKFEKINLILFTLGFFIPYLIIFLKAVGIVITNKMKGEEI
jgi:hypothetical protein